MMFLIGIFIFAIFGGLSVLFFVLASRSKKSMEETMRRCQVSTTAQIVDIEVNRGMRDDDGFRTTYYRPVYLFYVNNMPVTVRPKVATNKRYVINQMVELRYDPYDPNVFYVPTDGSNNTSKIFIILGVAFAVAAVLAATVSVIGFVMFGIWGLFMFR